MLKLTQEFGAHSGRVLSFEKGPIRMGRAPDNEVAFDPNLDLDSSAKHCELVLEQGTWWVVDAGSRNGTFVNGVRIQRQAVKSNDLIECGRGGPRLRVLFGLPPTTAMEMPPTPGFTPVNPGSTGPYAPVQPPPLAPLPPPVGVPIPTPPSMGHVISQAPVAPNPIAVQPPTMGNAIASQLPSGAHVGKKTVAMLIDQALVQAEARRSNRGLYLALGVTAVLVVSGFAVGAWLLMEDRRELRELSEQPRGGGERISAENEGAIYLLAFSPPGRRPSGFCTGFAVTPTILATNAHCVDAAQAHQARGETIVALQSNGRGVPVTVTPLFRDARFRDANFGLDGSGFDVGLLRAAMPLPVQVRLARNEELLALRAGAEVYVYGFPGNTMNETSPVATITQGVINRQTDFFDRAADSAHTYKLQHTAQTTSGSSGSPIFLANGLVVAINAGSITDDERQRMVDPTTGRQVSMEVHRSSNFKYGMRADLIRAAIASTGDPVP